MSILMIRKWSKISGWFAFFAQRKENSVTKIHQKLTLSFLDFASFVEFQFPTLVWNKFAWFSCSNHLVSWFFPKEWE